MRVGAFGCFLAAGSFLLLVGFSFTRWTLLSPGRGSESAWGASGLGASLLPLAVAYLAVGAGFRAFLGEKPGAKIAAVSSVAASLVLGILGALLLFDRYPCSYYLYCTGQVLGALGGFAFYFWALVPLAFQLATGTLVLEEALLTKDSLMATAAGLWTIDGIMFAPLIFGARASVALFFATLALSVAANGLMGGALLEHRRRAPR